MIHAGPYANTPDRPDPVAPQKFADVDVTEKGHLFLYDTLNEQLEEYITSDVWVDVRGNL